MIPQDQRAKQKKAKHNKTKQKWSYTKPINMDMMKHAMCAKEATATSSDVHDELDTTVKRQLQQQQR